MSISLEETYPGRAVADRALHLLKGQDNPFESLSRPQRADESFADIHVPEFQRAERECLLKMIDWYRLTEYHEQEHLRPSRAVTVQGYRGSGKTHLLQSLVARPDRKAQLVVRPMFFEKSLEFEEYLLGQLKNALQQPDEFHVERPIDVMAQALTRRLLRQAILAATPTDKLFATKPRGWTRLRLLWGRGANQVAKVDSLSHTLLTTDRSKDLPDLVRGGGLTPEAAFQLIQGHVRRFEVGTELRVCLRRLLYGALVRSALLNDPECLPQFLANGYTQADEGGGIPRGEMVSSLLHVLCESCALVQMPIIFAFDNLERFFSPQNTFDADLTGAFLRGLAQGIDNTRGILFLLFAEMSLFEKQIVPHMDSFVRQRLEQGIPVEGEGPTFLVRLAPPSVGDIEVIVHSRVRTLLADLSEAKDLRHGFPFSQEFLSDPNSFGTSNLRNLLIRLRDEYSRVVYGRAPAGSGEEVHRPGPGPTPLPEPNWTTVLEQHWKNGGEAARKLWDLGRVNRQELHNCLGGLLLNALPLDRDNWTLQKVIASQPIGDNPDYGVVTVLHWRVRDGIVAPGPQSLRVAVGFLLAASKGMAIDLRAKFDYLREFKKGARLVILWPGEDIKGDPADKLPPGTRKVWEDESDHRWKAELRRCGNADIRVALAFRSLLSDTEASGQSPPAEAIRSFLQTQADKLLPLLLPPTSGRGIDED